MADLFNQQISATYSGLLKTTSNGVLSSSLAQITDGRGNGSQLYLSTSKIKFYNAYEFPTNDGSANQVLKTDGSGVLTWEDDASGGVTKTGTIALNTIAVWNDNVDELRSDTSMSINTNHTISLLQKNSANNDVGSFNIGGGNIADVTGQNNTGFGMANMQRVTTGSNNVAFGGGVLDRLTIGSSNVGLGKNSLFSCTEGDANTGVGHGSLGDVTTGDDNTALGEGTGIDITTTSGNTFIGKDSGRQATGSNNTYVGFNSGSSLLGGDNNVIIGSNTGSTISTTSNNIIISDGSGNNRIQVDSGGNVGIGVTPTDAHQISRTSGTTQDAKNIQLRIGSSTTSLAPYIRFQGQTSSSVNRFADIQLDTVNDLLLFFPPSQYANAPSALNISSGGTATFSGDIIRKGNVGNISFEGGSATNINAQIQYDQVNDTTGQLFFKTALSGTLATRLTISSGGDVSIGSSASKGWNGF
jgi:hypothetical protein